VYQHILKLQLANSKNMEIGREIVRNSSGLQEMRKAPCDGA